MRKNKSTEHALIVSVISIVLCCAMLFGTTYAWFADSVTASVATIEVGTLEVDLVDAEGKSFVVKEEGKAPEVSLTFAKAPINDTQVVAEGTPVYGEPGESYVLPTVYVKNTGTMDLKYTFAIEKVDGIAETVTLLDVMDFTITVDGVAKELPYIGELPFNGEPPAIVITGKMKTADELDNYQGENIGGITIKVDAEQIHEE